MDRPGQTYYYHQNAMWSPLALTDASGNVVERYAYDVYGNVSILDPSYSPLPPNSWGTPHSAVSNFWLFTGRQLDEESGLYFYRARYYDGFKGRFLQRDPVGYGEGMNLYEYVQSSPPNHTDPSGLADLNDPKLSRQKERADHFFRLLQITPTVIKQDVTISFDQVIQDGADSEKVREYLKQTLIEEYAKISNNKDLTARDQMLAMKICQELFDGISQKLKEAKAKDADSYSWKVVEDLAKKALNKPPAKPEEKKGDQTAGSVKGPGTGITSPGTAKGSGTCQLKSGYSGDNKYVAEREEVKGQPGEYELWVRFVGVKDADGGSITGKRDVVITFHALFGKGAEKNPPPITISVEFKKGTSVRVKKNGEETPWYYVGTFKFPIVDSVSIGGSPGTSKGPGNGTTPPGTAKGP
jgi:RHS repeat-associated protein